MLGPFGATRFAFFIFFVNSPVTLSAMMPSSTAAFAGNNVEIHGSESENGSESADSCPGRST